MPNDSEKSKRDYKAVHQKEERNQKLKNGDDLSNNTKRTLGDYVAAKSEEEKNKYTIRAGHQEAESGIDNNMPGAKNPFSRVGGENSYSLEGQSGIFPDLSEVADSDGVVDSDIYRDGERFVEKAVEEGLKRSRFSPDSRPTKDGFNWSGQSSLGKNNPKEEGVEFDDMIKIADAIMLKASGHIGVSSNTLKNTFVALTPGITQIGGRISSSELSPTSFEDAPNNNTEVSDNLSVEMAKTWGVVNSPSEQYGDKTPAGMAALAIAMTVTLKLAVEGLARIISVAKKDPYENNTPATRGPFPLGRRSGVETSDSFFKPREYFGIDNTDHEFAAALDRGIEVFFDFSKKSFGRVAKQPGYYVNLIRSINQAGVEVVNEFTSLGDIKGTGLEIAETAASIVDGLRSNKIIAFINIIAQMGDRSLKIEDMGFDANRPFSILDSLPNNGRNRAAKVKESKNSLRSAYRNSASKSSFLFPKSAIRANRSLGGSLGSAIAGLSSGNSAKFVDKGTRISTQDRKAIEKELEAEYVPFYFHDLRTNEIISFHAFLEQLEDNYQAKWNESNVIGRVDPVGTYESTKRSVNFAFKVAATSKVDFDNLWFKINKLMTMLYPQWSRGRQVSSTSDGGTTTFTQPFSQVMSASPMIRIRIGDVISSNYSRFSLARTFGLGGDDTNIVKGVQSDGNLKEYFEEAKNSRKRMEGNPAEFGEGAGYRVNETAMLSPKEHGGYQEVGSSVALQKARSLLSASAKNKRSLILASSTKVVIKKSPSTNDDLIVSSGDKKIAYYHVEVVDATSDELRGTFIVTHGDLFPDSDQIRSISLRASGISPDSFEIPDASFFDPQQNAIVRSFEDSGGKGLAGWVKSANMQEMISPQVTWETSDYGSRAPKMLKISIQFQPIHDIAPGIDEFGFNRAPIYNVGSISRNMSGVDDGETQDQNVVADAKANAKAIAKNSIKN